ncbi:FtsB family cell division protein [Paenibacillus lemnae]|uniref:Septum formation initiator family protein n=1 Tax=Paenibacillus lemnae TaxID=1330551 RepID=A0A848MAQ8_PAELE|nr:septum formation initiator family protein [Paenibacillus lemnae]NMO97755.1 septum formation initiator family protein [Paenibacillus lemnae]
MGRRAEQRKDDPSKTAAKSKGAKRRKTMYSALMVLFVGWAGMTLYHQHDNIQSTSRTLAQKQSEQKAVQTSLNELNLEVERLQDPEYIGQIARKKFGLYPPNEVPIIQPQE